jgi:4-diphosphocytidyl-2-C-methyl-D-erythritol kinase
VGAARNPSRSPRKCAFVHPTNFAKSESALAPAKINLTLRIVGRRADGFHELESLVTFAPFGDRLTFWPDEPLDLKVSGPMADGAGPSADNLVLRAARALADRIVGLRLGRFVLVKRLPSGAGLGGGSADAAAALRLIAKVNRLSLEDARIREAAGATGADIPVCLDAKPRVMRGIGEILSAPVTLPKLGILVVHPGVAVPTGPVFKALGLAPGEEFVAPSPAPVQGGEGNRTWQGASSPSPRLPSGRLRPSEPVIGPAKGGTRWTGYGEGRGEGAFPEAQTRGEAPSLAPILPSPASGEGKGGSDLSPQAGRGDGCGQIRLPWQAGQQRAARDALFAWLASERNDLESAAIAIAPQIADVLCAIAGLAGCRLARMSGSGSTCFGLFDSGRAAASAARGLAAARPSWWVRAGLLGN